MVRVYMKGECCDTIEECTERSTYNKLRGGCGCTGKIGYGYNGSDKRFEFVLNNDYGQCEGYIYGVKKDEIDFLKRELPIKEIR